MAVHGNVTLQQKGSWFEPCLGLSLWVLQLPLLVQRHAALTGDTKLPVGVNVNVNISACQPCDECDLSRVYPISCPMPAGFAPALRNPEITWKLAIETKAVKAVNMFSFAVKLGSLTWGSMEID